MRTIKKLSFNKNLFAKLILFLVLLFFFLSVSSSAQQNASTTRETLPEEFQVPIFLKTLTYDRSLGAKIRDTIQIGVLYFPDDAQSKKNKDAIIENLKLNKDKTVNGLPFSFMEIEFSAKKSLDDVIKAKKINVLYIAYDHSNVLNDIFQITRTKKILTVTGQVDYVKKGVSLGLGLEKGKPQILVNLDSARAEGSDFNASLLKLCKIVVGDK